ncbi:hypothetical protein RCL1_005573 [Eukaryota sp. TZLM3-RCL]
MPVLAIAVLRHNLDLEPTILCCENDLSSLSWMVRGKALEAIKFSCRTIVKRMTPSTRCTVTEDQWAVLAYLRSDSIACAVVTDRDYPSRAAFAVTAKVLDDFSKTVTRSTWITASDLSIQCPSLRSSLVAFQDPAKADQCTAILNTLEETKHVLYDSIEKLLKRGEQLDTLVAQSHDLTVATRMFYKRAKKTDRCCVVM